MAGIHITDIEASINYWRERSHPSDGLSLNAELRALAEVYALMAWRRDDEVDEDRMPAAARLAGLVRDDPRYTVYRDLLDQPGRRCVQGLRAQLRGGAALAGHVPG